MPIRKKQAQRLIAMCAAAVAFVLGMGARAICRTAQIESLHQAQIVLWAFSVVVLLCVMAEFLISNRAYKGLRYFWQYWTTKNRLEKQMLDAGFGIERSYYTSLPKIYLSFNNDFSSGTLKLRNSIKFDKRLDDIVMSAALGKYIVEYHNPTHDNNYYVFHLIDGSASFKSVFEAYSDFQKYNSQMGPYELFIDKRTHVKLQHSLIVGQTGSGKTVFTHNLILQMINKHIDYELYFADPKGSSLAVLGDAIDEDKTAADFDLIVELLKEFVQKMRKRKIEMKSLLKKRLDADYTTFELSPHVFIFDEYASFASILASQEKKQRDAVKALLYEVILQGRQLGFFVFITMQKSDATLLDTALRDNLPLKIVLGNAEQQTYVTAFGYADIPNRDYAVGEGVFTEPTLAHEPKLVQCPYCQFDILEAVYGDKAEPG